MLNGYHLITLTHRNAAIESIGYLIPAPDQMQRVLHNVQQFFGWEELYCLTTCNRALFSFYSLQPTNDTSLKTALIHQLNPALSDAQVEKLTQSLRIFHGGDAVRHIFEVASAMDSLVVGEREIVRQLRSAYDQCNAWGLTGDHFRLLIAQAIEVSKQVFNETGIGEKALSVVALAFQAMREKGLRPTSHVVLVGAGETNALAAKFLAKMGITQVTVFNRTLSKAQALAEQFGQGTALPLADLAYWNAPFDAMIVCTGATLPIVTPELYQSWHNPSATGRILVDLSVPNNVHPAVVSQFPVHYIQIEDLRERATEHLAFREQERQNAERIISSRLVNYRQMWHERQIERSLRPMIDQIKSVKSRAVEEVFADRFGQLDTATQALMLEMLDYMEKKCVAIPVKTVKEIATRRLAPALV